MVNNTLSSSADIVVLLLNGFVGEIHTSVSNAIKNNVKENILVSILKINYQNVKVLANAQWEETTMEMEMKNQLDVQFVEISKRVTKTSDSI